jgi:hypothetical protein
MKPSMLTTDRAPLDCFSMAKGRKSLKTQSRECLQVGCALLEGSHHEIKEQNKDESFESKVLQMKRYNHLSNNSTTHK